jgi:hypothetical protein
MSPREKHIPDDALRTTVALTAEDRAAARWITESRRGAGGRRTTINDVLVDALWFYLEKTEGKTREQIRAMIPPPRLQEAPPDNVTQMPTRKGKP